MSDSEICRDVYSDQTQPASIDDGPMMGQRRLVEAQIQLIHTPVTRCLDHQPMTLPHYEYVWPQSCHPSPIGVRTRRVYARVNAARARGSGLGIVRERSLLAAKSQVSVCSIVTDTGV